MAPEVLGERHKVVPSGLKRLLDDVAGTEKLGERIKQEILRDEDARRVSNCFFSVLCSGSYVGFSSKDTTIYQHRG
jgi:hypothetical protein